MKMLPDVATTATYNPRTGTLAAPSAPATHCLRKS